MDTGVRITSVMTRFDSMSVQIHRSIRPEETNLSRLSSSPRAFSPSRAGPRVSRVPSSSLDLVVATRATSSSMNADANAVARRRSPLARNRRDEPPATRVSLHRRASHRSNDSRVHERAENDERERKNAHASRARERDAREDARTARAATAGFGGVERSISSDASSRVSNSRASRTIDGIDIHDERAFGSIERDERGREWTQTNLRSARRRRSRGDVRVSTLHGVVHASGRHARAPERDHLSHLDVLARDVLETHATRPHDGVPLVILAIRRVDTVVWTLRISAIDRARTRTRASLLVGHARVHGRRNISHIRHSPLRARLTSLERDDDAIDSIEFSAARTRDVARDLDESIDRHSAPSRARVVVMSDDDSFVMNIANDGAGTSGRRGNPRARTVARTSKKDGEAAAGGRARAGRARAMGGQGKKRAREDSSARAEVVGRRREGMDVGTGMEGEGKVVVGGADEDESERRVERRARTGSRAEDDDDGFEVIRGEGANAENGEDGLEFNPRDWASLMKRRRRAVRDATTARARTVMTVGRVRTRARVIARECSGESRRRSRSADFRRPW